MRLSAPRQAAAAMVMRKREKEERRTRTKSDEFAPLSVFFGRRSRECGGEKKFFFFFDAVEEFLSLFHFHFKETLSRGHLVPRLANRSFELIA